MERETKENVEKVTMQEWEERTLSENRYSIYGYNVVDGNVTMFDKKTKKFVKVNYDLENNMFTIKKRDMI